MLADEFDPISINNIDRFEISHFAVSVIILGIFRIG